MALLLLQTAANEASRLSTDAAGITAPDGGSSSGQLTSGVPSWRDVACSATVAPGPFQFSAPGGKRCKVEPPLKPIFTFNESPWLKEDLGLLCDMFATLPGDLASFEIEMPPTEFIQSLGELQNRGVVLYFMGKMLKGLQLRQWADKALQPGAITKFITLGRGFYLAVCTEMQHRFFLLEKGSIWANNTFALAMPWHASFDPLTAFLSHCPVWVSFEKIPPPMLSQMDQVAAKMGKILYKPSQQLYVQSRNLRYCILWDLARPVPRTVKLKLGLSKPLYIAVSFSSFPTACYRCKQIGHYAKTCSSKDSIISLNHSSGGNAEVIHMKDDSHLAVSTPIMEIHADSPPSMEVLPVMENCQEQSTHEAVANPPSVDPAVFCLKSSNVTLQNSPPVAKDEDNLSIDSSTCHLYVDLGVISEAQMQPSEEVSDTSSSRSEFVEESDCSSVQHFDQSANSGSTPVPPSSSSTPLDDPLAREQLQRVHEDLHQYYDISLHKFKLPAVIRTTKSGKHFVVFNDGSDWRYAAFFHQHKLKEEEALFLSSLRPSVR